jgi:two-component system, NarL family, invasion response regulator UvrY
VIRILVVDDHAVVRAGLREFFAGNPDMVIGGEAASAREALRLLADGLWDVVLLDLSLPDGSGGDLLRRLKRERPQLPVLVLSMHAERRFALQLLRDGASGYLQKEAIADDLLEAIRAVLQGRRYFSPAVHEMLAAESAVPDDGPLHDALSEREFEIFSRIAQGQGASRIARELGLSVKTVSTYRSRVLDKMRMASNADLTYYAIKHHLMD